MIALAALAAVAFAPPVDHALLFRTEQVVQRQPRPIHYSMVEQVRFTRVSAGWRMDVMMISSGSDAPPVDADVFDLMMSAFDRVTTSYILSPAGRPADVVDPDRVWRRTLAALDRTLQLRFRSLAPAAHAAFRAFRDGYAATPPAARRAMLLDNAAALLAPPKLPGTAAVIAFDDVASDTAGRPVAVAGTVRRIAAAPGQVTFRIDAASAGPNPSADRVRESRTLAIATRDGLLLSSERRITAGNGPPLVDETITRIR